MNFAQNWFNSIFISISFQENSIQKIIQFKTISRKFNSKNYSFVNFLRKFNSKIYSFFLFFTKFNSKIYSFLIFFIKIQFKNLFKIMKLAVFNSIKYSFNKKTRVSDRAIRGSPLFHCLFFGRVMSSPVRYPCFLIEWIFHWIEYSQFHNFE